MEQNWFKVWPKQFLKDDKLKGLENVRRRGVFVSILSIAKVCRCGGRLINSLDEPITFDEIVIMAGITDLDLIDLISVDLLSCNEGLHFVKNWRKYQSDYDRQKEYRNKKVVTIGDNKSKVVTGTGSDMEMEREIRDLRLRDEMEIKTNGGDQKSPLQNPRPTAKQIFDQVAQELLDKKPKS